MKHLFSEDQLKITRTESSQDPSYYIIHLAPTDYLSTSETGTNGFYTLPDNYEKSFTDSIAPAKNNFEYSRALLILAADYTNYISSEERIKLFNKINELGILTLGILCFWQNDLPNHFEVSVNNSTQEILLNRKNVNVSLANFNKGLLNQEGLLLLIEGYKKAGAILLEICIASANEIDLPAIVFPCIFNLRQYSVLIMKDTIRKIRIILNELYVGQDNFSIDQKYHHLFIELKEYLLKLQLIKNDTDLSEIMPLIGFFNNNDIDSYRYRYPFKSEKDSYGRVQYSKISTKIDILSFKDKFLRFETSIEIFNSHVTEQIKYYAEVL